MIRRATLDDADELSALDAANWSTLMTPTPFDPERRFFDRSKPEDVLVAELDGRIAGYAKLSRVHEIPASDHVLHVNGLSVLSEFRGREYRDDVLMALDSSVS